VTNSLADLETLEEMRTPFRPAESVLLTGEREAEPAPDPDRLERYDVGVVEGDGFYEVLYTCAGSAPFKLIWSEGTGAGEMLFSLGFQGCPGRTEIFSSGAVPPVARLSVETSPGMAWRVVVVKPTPDPILSGSPATGLPEPPAIDTEPLFVPVASTELLEGVAEAMLANLASRRDKLWRPLLRPCSRRALTGLSGRLADSPARGEDTRRGVE